MEVELIAAAIVADTAVVVANYIEFEVLVGKQVDNSFVYESVDCQDNCYCCSQIVAVIVEYCNAAEVDSLSTVDGLKMKNLLVWDVGSDHVVVIVVQQYLQLVQQTDHDAAAKYMQMQLRLNS